MKTLIVAALLAIPGAQAFADELPWWLGERKILGENNLEPIAAAIGTESYEYSRGVARVEWRDAGEGFCTGSRVGEDLILTNSHCVDIVPCEGMQFTFGYEDGLPEEQRQTFSCVEVVSMEMSLDYALLRIKQESDIPETLDPYPVMTLWGGPIVDGQELIVPGHPATRAKEIDRSSECVIKSAEVGVESGRRTIYHMCDTEGGSSGSPVLDRATGHIIALHWGGRYEMFNMAIPIYLILEHLRENAPEVLTELTIVTENKIVQVE